MKTKIPFAILLTLALFRVGHAQTLDKAKLDQFLDRLAEKNKGMGSLTLAKDGNVVYSRSFGYLCRHHSAEIPFQTLTPEAQNWLMLSMDYGRGGTVRRGGRKKKSDLAGEATP